jgi:endonuclease/exonuclease/phosphatase family metal-dependent hydrolase
MLIRAWNVFHGNTSPPGRRAYLREMIELVTADRPGVVCLQEVPAWAFGQIGDWAGMREVAARTRAPRLGLLPIPAGFGRRLTSLNAGLFRSHFNGQGNVILLPTDAKLRESKQITLNTNPFCEDQATKLGLSPKLARWWEKERRICHLAKVELPNRRRLLIANLHATHYYDDLRLADAELRRAASFVDRASEIEEIVVLAGDFNTTLEHSETLRSLTTREDDPYSGTGPLIDHVLVRGGKASEMRVWGDDERMYDGKLLSDHAPVELQLLAVVRRRTAQAPALVEPARPEPEPEPAPAPSRREDDDRWETEERWETKEEDRFETGERWEGE